MSFEQQERERMLAYIDGQLASGRRDPEDIAALRKRRAAIEAEGRRPGLIARTVDRVRRPERPTPVDSTPPVDPKAIAERMAKSARDTAERATR